MPPNVLLVVLDTARADAFGPYGASPDAAPTVGQVASSGRAIPDVYSTACWTLPSHASMFTGRLPRSLGLGQAPGGSPLGARPVLEAQRERLLPEVLRRAGYETRGLSANVWVSEAAGFATGFDVFEEVERGGRQAEVERDDMRGRLVWALEGLRARTDDGAAAAEATLARWASELNEKPFFWFVNLVECHSPYMPPRPFNDLPPLDRVRAADEARRHLSMMSVWRACVSDFDVPDEALERMRRLYAASVRYVDDWLGRVISRLDERGVLDDTLVIVTSDHGENFGEGGLLAHAFSLDDRLIHVPVVVNRADFATGDGPRSLVQLPQLIAEFVDLAEHPWSEDPLPQGYAAAQFEFVDEDDPRIDIAADLWGLQDEQRERLFTPLTCVTDGQLKLMARGQREELYDLANDPLELHPLPPGDAPDRERVASLRAALADQSLWELADVAQELPDEGGQLDGIERRMKLLGYM
jgi:arylsulfatase A-like enzyme